MNAPVAAPCWALRDEVAAGTRLVADGGFTCISEGSVLTVEVDERGAYVPCTVGHHYLDGQLDHEGRYVGLTLAPETAEASR